MPQQQHKKVKLYTCMPDQTLQVSISAIEPEWPGFLSDKVGAGRKYLTRGRVISDNYFCRSCCLTGECYRTFGGFQLTPTGPISPSRTSSISLFSAEAYTSCLAITPRHCLTVRWSVRS